MLLPIMISPNSWTLLMNGSRREPALKNAISPSPTRHYYYHGVEAAKVAIERAGITAQDIDLIIFATLSPIFFSRAAEYYCNAC